MNLKDFVLENQKIIELVRDRVAGENTVDMYEAASELGKNVPDSLDL